MTWRRLAAERGAWANIPPRCNRNEPICLSPYLYHARKLVERFFNKINQYGRVAFIQLASIRLWRRINESTPGNIALFRIATM
jgi:transposase